MNEIPEPSKVTDSEADKLCFAGCNLWESDLEIAYGYFVDGLNNDPEHIRCRYNKALIEYHHRKDEKAALRDFYRVPTHLDSPYYIGKIRFETNQEDAFEHFSSGAYQGNKKCILEAAECLWHGHGTCEDKVDAVNFYQKIDQDELSTVALFRVGLMKEDPCYLRMAMENGHEDAGYHLALLLADDDEEKVELMKAAVDNHPEAEEWLIKYWEGRWDEINMVEEFDEGLKWVSEKNTNMYLVTMLTSGNMDIVGKIYHSNIDVFSTRAGMKLARHNDGLGKYHLSFAIYTHLAQKGDEEGMYRYGRALRRGLGCTRDITEANKWNLKAAEKGFALAMIEEAHVASNTKPETKESLEKVKKWYGAASRVRVLETAQLQVYEYAKRKLEEMESGKELSVWEAASAKLLKKAQAGDETAKMLVAFVYFNVDKKSFGEKWITGRPIDVWEKDDDDDDDIPDLVESYDECDDEEIYNVE